MLANATILHKLTAAVLLIAAMVGGCVWYAQGRMTAIDDAYSRFIVREARAPASASRLNRILYTLSYTTFRIVAETDEAQMHRASTEFDEAIAGVKRRSRLCASRDRPSRPASTRSPATSAT